MTIFFVCVSRSTGLGTIDGEVYHIDCICIYNYLVSLENSAIEGL